MRMAEDFAKLLESPKFKKYVGAGAEATWENIIRAFGGTVTNDRASGVKPAAILKILISHP